MATIRPATAHDLARIEEIYDTIHTAEEAGKVSIGWVRGVYPTRATAQAGLDAGDLFVLADGGTVYAAGRINREQVPVYAEVPWAHDVPPEQVLVLHTLVVDPAVAGHGCGTQFVRFYEQRARALARLPGTAHRHEREKRQRPPALRLSRLPRGRSRAVHVQRHRRRGARVSGKVAGRRAVTAGTYHKTAGPGAYSGACGF